MQRSIDRPVLSDGEEVYDTQAVRVMSQQDEDGHIFNIDGAGANGRPTPRFAAYGATKHALMQFNESLNAELKLQEINNIGLTHSCHIVPYTLDAI